MREDRVSMAALIPEAALRKLGIYSVSQGLPGCFHGVTCGCGAPAMQSLPLWLEVTGTVGAGESGSAARENLSPSEIHPR